MVLGNDEQGHRQLDGKEEWRPLAVNQKPCEKGEACCAEDGGQRYVSGEQQNEGENGDGAQRGGWRGDQEDSKASGNAFSAVEAKPDGKDVTKHRGECGESLHVANMCVRGEQHADEGSDVDGEAAFDHVAEKCGCAQAFAAGTEDVGGPDVAAADGTDILLEKEADQQVSDGDGAEQVCDGNDEQACKEHDEGEFNRSIDEGADNDRVNTCGRANAACAAWGGEAGGTHRKGRDGRGTWLFESEAPAAPWN